MVFKIWAAALSGASILGGCSTLHVEKDSDRASENGVPVAMMKQEFRASLISRDDSGADVGAQLVKVELATVPDSSRRYRVSNSPTLFASSNFTITRSDRGAVTSLSATTTDTAQASIKAVGELLLGVLRASEQDSDELKSLRAKRVELYKALANATDRDEIAKLVAVIKQVEEQIKVLKTPAPVVTPTKPSRYLDLTVVEKSDYAGVDAYAKSMTTTGDEPSVAVILVPTARSSPVAQPVHLIPAKTEK